MILLFQQLEPLTVLIVVALVLFGLVLHNVVQALVAASQGDDTAKNYGFTSTDPRVHLEPLYLLFLAILGFAVPRPIPVNSRRVRGRGWPEALIWLSGPLALIAWAFVLMVIHALLRRFAPSEANTLLTGLSVSIVQYLVPFAIIYLVPVPPLDGARALMATGNLEARRFLRQVESYGFIGFLLIFIVLSYTGILGGISRVVIGALNSVLALVGL